MIHVKMMNWNLLKSRMRLFGAIESVDKINKIRRGSRVL